MGSLMEERRRIMVNAPHIETASGLPLSIRTDLALKPEEMIVTFVPKQSGSGAPSLDNVRPISLYSSVTVTVNGTDYESTFSRSFCGAAVDIITPKAQPQAIASHWHFDSSALSSNYISSVTTIGSFTRFWMYHGLARLPDVVPICDKLPSAPSVGYGTDYSKQELKIGATNDYLSSVWIIMPSSVVGTTATSVYNYLKENPIVIAYPRGEGGNYNTTKHSFRLSRGLNTITTNANDRIQIKYWTH